ncbi:hypothetical protein EDB84DRAFT_1438923 [Lactarius hengduanensis]|nr:hypothetical protein EDB84DRAFT_1438923 [Lactarius hengduanensis]
MASLDSAVDLPSLNDMRDAVKNRFGFFPCTWQLEAALTQLRQMDLVTLAPTGSGKTLTFWMPLGITTGRQNPYGSRVRVTRVRVRVAILGPVPNPYPWHGYPRFRHYLAQDDNEAHFHLTNIDRPRVPASRAVSVRHARIGGNVAHLRFSPSPHLYFGLGILTSLYDQNSPLEQLHTPSFCTSFDAENSSMVRREVAVGDAKPPPHPHDEATTTVPAGSHDDDDRRPRRHVNTTTITPTRRPLRPLRQAITMTTAARRPRRGNYDDDGSLIIIRSRHSSGNHDDIDRDRRPRQRHLNDHVDEAASSTPSTRRPQRPRRGDHGEATTATTMATGYNYDHADKWVTTTATGDHEEMVRPRENDSGNHPEATDDYGNGGAMATAEDAEAAEASSAAAAEATTTQRDSDEALQ